MPKHTFKAELTLMRNQRDEQGKILHKDGRCLTENVPSVLIITVDPDAIARAMGHKAMKNRRRVAIEIGGAVEVEWRAR